MKTDLTDKATPQTGRRLKAWLLAGALTLTAAAGAQEPVVVSASSDIIDDYHAFLDGRDPLAIKDFSGPHARRDVVELVLMHKALDAGGFERPITFKPEHTYRRVLQLLAGGRRLSTGGTKWYRDLARVESDVWISEPLIEDGDFVVGLYTPEDNLALLAGQTAPLQQQRVVTNPHWRADVEALDALGFSRRVYAADWPSIVRMLEAGRADLTLAPFPAAPDLILNLGGTRLRPIPERRVAIPGSRHWAVSRRHPQGDAFHQALSRGLAVLKAEGIVERAYRQSGFMSERTADWPILTPETQKSRPQAAE